VRQSSAAFGNKQLRACVDFVGVHALESGEVSPQSQNLGAFYDSRLKLGRGALNPPT
jgi:hypothetical protein